MKSKDNSKVSFNKNSLPIKNSDAGDQSSSGNGTIIGNANSNSARGLRNKSSERKRNPFQIYPPQEAP